MKFNISNKSAGVKQKQIFINTFDTCYEDF